MTSRTFSATLCAASVNSVDVPICFRGLSLDCSEPRMLTSQTLSFWPPEVLGEMACYSDEGIRTLVHGMLICMALFALILAAVRFTMLKELP